MGTGPSSLGGTLSREKLLEGTKVTRQIVDIIFEYLMENIKLRDFYSLSSPDKCRRYVLFTANTLYSKFIQVQVQPQKGKDGVIWFRSVSDLTNPPKSSIGSDPLKDPQLQQQKLCLQLAYFYVRILQIYGALALTLIDDSKFMVDHGYTRGIFTSPVIEQPGKLPYYAAGPKKEYTLGPQKQRMSGGGLYDIKSYRPIEIREISRLELFQCLHTVLYTTPGVIIDTDRRDKSYWIKFTKKPEDQTEEGPGTILTIRQMERQDGKKVQEGKLTLESGRNNAVIYVTATPEYSTSGSLNAVELKFNPNVRVHINGRDQTLYNFLDSKIKHNFTFIYDGVQTIHDVDIILWKVMIDRRKEPIEIGLQEFILQVWDRIKILIKSGQIDIDKISEITPTQFVEDREAIQHLKIQPIIDGMTRKRKFGHCVGRALQLLTTIPSLSGIRDMNSKATSSICDLKFSRDYIDTPTGVSLSDSASISSLANLFYDTVTVGYPRADLTIGGETMSEYVTFIKQMSELFMDKSFADADIIRRPDDALKDIKAKQSGACDKDNRKIILDNKFAMTFVYPHVLELFRTQLVHASNCAKIFAQLFDIRKEGEQYKVRIHPNVIAKGIDEVNRLAKITRNVLITYYSNCETVYVKGVMNIENAFKGKDPAVSFYEKPVEEDEEEKRKYVFKDSKDSNLLESRYNPEDIEKYLRERRIRERRDSNNDRYRGRWGGATRKQKRK